MTYGLKVTNNAGSVLIDDVYPQPSLKATGTLPATAVVASMPDYLREPASVSFGSTVSNPFLLVRAALNCSFTIGLIDNNGFSYASNGVVDWRVYSAAAQSYTPSGFGLLVKNSASQIIYDSNYPPPSIFQTATLANPAPTTSGDTLLTTWTVSGTSMDGGLPFLNADAIAPCSVLASNAGQWTFGICAVFTSASVVEIRQRIVRALGNPYASPQTMQSFQIGMNSRTFLFSR